MKPFTVVAGSLALVALVFSAAFAYQAHSAGPARIAFVSPNRLAAQSPVLRAVVAKFQAAQHELGNAVKAKQAALEDARRKLAQATPADRAQLEKQVAQAQEDLQRGGTQAQIELQNSQREMQAALQAQLGPVLEELSQSQQIDAFFNADTGALWSRKSLDLTPVVLERLNARAAAGAAKP